MAAQRKTAKGSSIALRIAAVACASVVAVGCIGFGMASAGNGAAAAETFGLAATATTLPQTAKTAQVSSGQSSSDNMLLQAAGAAREATVLTSTAPRDISQGVQDIEAEREAARIAAEKLALAQRDANMAKAQAASGITASQGLAEVDWSIGKDAFIAEWTERIDAYLYGTPLAGYGVNFATAAWEYGVDPRWSPAISNTESSRGKNCFRYCNAWGWGSSGWPSWEVAIDAHVYGLSQGYGYTISLANAQKYCPPTYQHWYADTLQQMKYI